MSLKDSITSGIGAHGKWKQRLIDAINTGQSEWKPEIVCQDNQCDFGKWLYSCSNDEKASPHFETVKQLHAEFHKEAAKVLELALASKKEAANEAIGPSSKYLEATTKLTKEMMAWKDQA